MGCQDQRWGANPLFWPFFPENCMKLKQIGPKDVPSAPLDPPINMVVWPWLDKSTESCSGFGSLHHMENIFMTRNCTWWMPQMSVVLHKQHIVSPTLIVKGINISSSASLQYFPQCIRFFEPATITNTHASWTYLDKAGSIDIKNLLIWNHSWLLAICDTSLLMLLTIRWD